jgi:hypothetical protein
MVDDGSGNRVDRHNLRTAAWGGLIGTALEQYDFVIYGTATAIVFNDMPAPAFLMLDTGNTALIVLVIVLGFIFAAYGTVGSQAAAFAELAGSRYRYAAVALAREFSAMLGGGIAPLLSGVLVQLLAGWIGVVIYMMAIMSVTLVTAIRMPETRGRDLKLVEDA